jgi:hypothetical protein
LGQACDPGAWDAASLVECLSAVVEDMVFDRGTWAAGCVEEASRLRLCHSYMAVPARPRLVGRTVGASDALEVEAPASLTWYAAAA